jgi:hypothetical protein
MSTDTGPDAKAHVEGIMAVGTIVTMRREPGVDRDRYGRELQRDQVASAGLRREPAGVG